MTQHGSSSRCHFETFKGGGATVWIIKMHSLHDSTPEVLLRKIDDERIGLPAWIEREGANTFIRETNGLPACDIVQVNFAELKEILGQMEEFIRRRVVLDLVRGGGGN